MLLQIQRINLKTALILIHNLILIITLTVIRIRGIRICDLLGLAGYL